MIKSNLNYTPSIAATSTNKKNTNDTQTMNTMMYTPYSMSLGSSGSNTGLKGERGTRASHYTGSEIMKNSNYKPTQPYNDYYARGASRGTHSRNNGTRAG